MVTILDILHIMYSPTSSFNQMQIELIEEIIV
jgi:hypothetical protein